MIKEFMDTIKNRAGLQGPIIKSERTLFQGNFNHTEIYKDSLNNEFIVRRMNPEGRLVEIPRIEAEYKGVGFLSNPNNSVFYRTYLQQAKTAHDLQEVGIPVIMPRVTTENFQIIDFFHNSMNLTESWLHNHPKASEYTTLMLDELRNAHKKGMLLGDRRGGNELILENGTFKFIDFDIGIAGPEAREFDVAGFFYFIAHKVHIGNNERLPELLITLRKFLHSDEVKNNYNWPLLISYIKRYYNYFENDGFYRFDTSDQNKRFVTALLEE